MKAKSPLDASRREAEQQFNHHKNYFETLSSKIDSMPPEEKESFAEKLKTISQMLSELRHLIQKAKTDKDFKQVKVQSYTINHALTSFAANQALLIRQYQTLTIQTRRYTLFNHDINHQSAISPKPSKKLKP